MLSQRITQPASLDRQGHSLYLPAACSLSQEPQQAPIVPTSVLLSNSSSSSHHDQEVWVGSIPFAVIVADPFLPASLYECKNILDFVNPIYRGQKFYFCPKTYPAGGTKCDGPGLKKLRKALQKAAVEHGGFHLTSNGGGGKRCVFKCACGRMTPAAASSSSHSHSSQAGGSGRNSPSCVAQGGSLCGMNFTIRCDDAEHGYYLAGGYGKAEHSHHARMKAPSVTVRNVPVATATMTPLRPAAATPESPKPVIQLETQEHPIRPTLPLHKTTTQSIENITTIQGDQENAEAPDIRLPLLGKKAEQGIEQSSPLPVSAVTEKPEVATAPAQEGINVYKELAPITRELFDVYHENTCTPSELDHIKQWMKDMIHRKRGGIAFADTASHPPTATLATTSVPSAQQHLPSRTKRPIVIHEDGEAAVLLSSFKRSKYA